MSCGLERVVKKRAKGNLNIRYGWNGNTSNFIISSEKESTEKTNVHTESGNSSRASSTSMPTFISIEGN